MAVKTRKKAKKKAKKKVERTNTEKKPKMSPKKRTKKRNIYDRLSQQAEEKRGSGGYGEKWDAPVGKSIVRPILFRDEDGEEDLLVDWFHHWFVNHEGKHRTVRCAGRGDCPICGEKDNIVSGVWNVVKLTKRVFCNLLVRDDNKVYVGNLRVSCARILAEELSKIETENPLDPKKGRDVTIVRSGKGLDTEYDILISPKKSPIGEFDGEVRDLNKMIPPINHEQLAEALECILEMKPERRR